MANMITIFDLFFLNLAITVTLAGVLLHKCEELVPAFIKKGFNYGSFAYQGSEANFLQAIEIPKAYYKHFYLFSSILSVVTLCYMVLVYFLNFPVNNYVTLALHIVLDDDEPMVSGCVVTALLAMSLLTVQCLRRLYETYCLQVFAKSSKMNISHYLAGIIHYFACIVVGIGQAPLFCGDQNRQTLIWIDTKTMIVSIPCVITFMWCWWEQYKTNVILANLRKDKKTGEVITEEHRVPQGRLFKYVSSPHRLCEILMYTVLLILIPTRSFCCIYLWVYANQIQTALQAHEWYKKTFKNYPAERCAIVPLIL